MSNLLSVSASITATTNANAATAQRLISSQFAMSGNLVSSGVVAVATSDTQLPLAGISTIGWVYLHNCDSTNYVTVGADGTHYPVQMMAGEFILTRWNGSAVHCLANTATVNVEFIILAN